jgi:peptidoglycan hydrolase-like protein with peptidoglycan-binding domain
MRAIWVRAALAAIIAIFFACADGADDRETVISIGDTTPEEPADASAYWNNEPPLSLEDIELGRHDSTWLEIAAADTSDLRLAMLDTVDVEPLGSPPPIRVSESFPETYADFDRLARSESDTALPVVQLPVAGEAQGPSVLYVQVLLDRSPFSPGILDGKWGKNTRKAVYWLQRSAGMDATGEVDSLTFLRLVDLAGRPDRYIRTVRLTESDVAGPFVDIPEDIHAQAELECMCYRSALEKVAERYHAAPELLEQLNPGQALDSLAAGDSLRVPNVPEAELAVREPGTSAPRDTTGRREAGVAADTAGTSSTARGRADTAGADPDSVELSPGGEVAEIVVSIDGFYLHALDADGRLLYHFPTTVGSRYQPSPTGEFSVASIAFDPWFHWQPALFDEVPDTEEDERIPPGPNSPVGIVWMALSKDNYGIHGTGEPATIGYASSHGCVRLTNWDARFLAERVSAGVSVVFRDLAAEEEPVARAEG